VSRILAAAAQKRSLVEFRLDLLRELGIRHSTRRMLANAEHRRALGGRRTRVAELMWREAADELGADMRELGPGLFEFRLGERHARVLGQNTPFANAVAEALASDKPLAYRVLADAGLPTPHHALVSVGDGAQASDFLAGAQGPLVVKPARGRGGAGVTGGVRSPMQLRKALVSAGRYAAEALIEQQVDGDSYRLLLLDGEVLDVIARSRPTVIGDGQRTIEELMFEQYARRIATDAPSGLKPLVVDLDCLFTLERAGLGIRSVPADGASVTIKTATNFNAPEETRTVHPPYPEAFVSLARRAAAALDVRLAGVDLVASDGGETVVLEVNPVPGLTHHYNVAEPQRATPVAVPILRSLLVSNGAAATPGAR
jgi:D-alanine-D-alanine ligase-like ATP-grasp enzyme